jgi:16S rRNA (guanine1516-N2)-methyltransferase
MKSSTSRYTLLVTPDYVGLQDRTDPKSKPFYIDFLSGGIRYRGEKAGLRNELLARAMGMKPKDNPRIIDATAGLGRDSFILATLGFTLTLLERSPILYALLQDALNRAKRDPETATTISRMQLIEANAIDWLAALPIPDRPHIIYLDPMFPERKKSASVKKEMAILHNVLGTDLDCAALLTVALTCATKRVVVKRPRLAPTINDQKPSFSLTGKHSRFDIYLV